MERLRPLLFGGEEAEILLMPGDDGFRCMAVFDGSVLKSYIETDAGCDVHSEHQAPIGKEELIKLSNK